MQDGDKKKSGRGVSYLLRIQYCGGCNPSYDRVAFVRSLEKAIGNIPELKVKICMENISFADFGILVCGCPAHCIDKKDIREGLDTWRVVGLDQLDYRYVPLSEIPYRILREIVERCNHTISDR